MRAMRKIFENYPDDLEITDVELVRVLFDEVKNTFARASDEDAKKILDEIRWFQRIHFEL